MTFKILCTGNPERMTIAKAIKEVFPDAEFIHMSVGYDFTTNDGLERFRQRIRNYNVFVNASRIDHEVQINLLKITREEWSEGHVFNIGSVLEYDFFKWISPETHVAKNKLRQLSLDLSSEKFKTTHIIVGGFKDESEQSESKMDPKHVAKMIEMILSINDFHVPIIGIENDYWLRSPLYGAQDEWPALKLKGLNLVERL